MKYWIILFLNGALFAQNDSIHILNEVKLYGHFSPKLNAGFQVDIIRKETLERTTESLGNLLQNEANLYFKQNGNGMVSSIAMRGSNASQTAVFWNGIAINSSLNGQTDFNTLSPKSYNQIEIRKGAGSTTLGSGAIGGAINLRDRIYFYNKKETQFNLRFGSYNTQNIFASSRYSTNKIYGKISIEGAKSNNDYPYLGTTIRNENGKYNNQHIKSIIAYKKNDKNEFIFYNTISKNNRELSRTLNSPNNAKYLNTENRFLIEWRNGQKNYQSILKLAFLNEKYQYFFNKDNEEFSYGKSNNYIAKYDFDYVFNSKINFKTGLENKLEIGNGSNIQLAKQNKIAFYVAANHYPTRKMNYTVSIRKGFSNTYTIPFVFAIGSTYKATSKLKLKTNISTNYKLPSFNDLFWSYSGNPNLQSERNKAAELSFNYKAKNTILNFTTFYTKSDDLIQWRPVSSTFWRPINIQKVVSYGLEINGNKKILIKKHSVKLSAQYNFTIAKDKILQKQLIYIPFHKANATISYVYKKWRIKYNQQYNGFVYTTTSNTQKVNDFWLSNIYIDKYVYKNKINIGFSIHNIFNQSYQTVAYRPMPNRNFNLNINLKI